jgi:hypothetical protein
MILGVSIFFGARSQPKEEKRKTAKGVCNNKKIGFSPEML